jgi:hypothetical protein
MIVVLAMLTAGERLHRAAWLNPRYRFTTWRWGKVAVALLVGGAVLNLATQL